MEERTRKAFISYSWDNEEHKQWVMDLVSNLRRNGIEASFDRYITQSSTVNLNQMMITNMKDTDYIVIVLTEQYAEKANSFQGGVGFETLLSLPLLQEHPEKLIFVVRSNSGFQKAFPFHLKGYYAIDFSSNKNYENAFTELLHRIYEVPLLEIEPIGKMPELKPRRSTSPSFSEITDVEIPNLKRITDRDIHLFMHEKFREINDLLKELFTKVQESNANFEFTAESQESAKSVYHVYIDGQYVTGLKVWLESSSVFRQASIHLSYGRQSAIFNDNSYNEAIVHEIDHNKNLRLKMTMNIFGNNEAQNPNLIVKEIWKNHLLPYIK
ncbi:toll/interleukin-1 receptor domain-containing protein [Halalkalibacter akibai]|uniref:SEFIR domain containing protein n=1 Tax=Halalkalibacter akibai (strain ATCC 43226 / DSM 21942 / CIP 109018 / JCM 9157 / 1139) TaxID=1236973 RepID=W4QXQ3_HALA3|nr:toll/interleukin-1 receptor domain-containing protein [Halalkalibacter akibai]GAE36692.1 SEFIR domain containing protein [Halalkalibacter akibai JCM 9157]